MTIFKKSLSVFFYSFTDATSSGEAEIYQRSLRTITSGLVGLRNCLHEQQEGATNMMPPAFVCSNYFQGKSFMCGHWVWSGKKLWSGFLNCPGTSSFSSFFAKLFGWWHHFWFFKVLTCLVYTSLWKPSNISKQLANEEKPCSTCPLKFKILDPNKK